jgi:hypothetical protein
MNRENRDQIGKLAGEYRDAKADLAHLQERLDEVQSNPPVAVDSFSSGSETAHLLEDRDTLTRDVGLLGDRLRSGI